MVAQHSTRGTVGSLPVVARRDRLLSMSDSVVRELREAACRQEEKLSWRRGLSKCAWAFLFVVLFLVWLHFMEL